MQRSVRLAFGHLPRLVSSPLFTYGILRLDGEGWSQLLPLSESHCRATTKGCLWFAFGEISYPVAKFDCDGEIVGDLYRLDFEHPIVQSVIAMEEGAGYELKRITVKTETGEEVAAFGFEYRWGVHTLSPVPNNDWREAVNW